LRLSVIRDRILRCVMLVQSQSSPQAYLPFYFPACI
jgi:hypothetical protein